MYACVENNGCIGACLHTYTVCVQISLYVGKSNTYISEVYPAGTESPDYGRSQVTHASQII